MNAHTILNKMLSAVTPNMHKTRRTAVSACVFSLMRGASATVTGIGRGIAGRALEKHNIKRADRLCSNSHLLSELPGVYGAISRYVVGQNAQPVILVDWSDLDEYKRHFLLRASLVFKGRAITLYQEVHTVKTKEKPATHQAFLTRLKAILGEACQPVIVTDAGFKTPWFRQVRALGWHFVGRSRKPNYYQTGQQDWQCISTLYPSATGNPHCFEARLCRNHPLDCRLVLYKSSAKGRKDINRYGQPRRSHKSLTYAKRSIDPWLLCTSLPAGHALGKQVVKIYQSRMQIEEGFRDMKSRQYGLGFEQNKTLSRGRLSILILLSTLASLVLMMAGLIAQTAHWHRRYQANTTSHRPVLSLHFLGLRVIADKRFSFGRRLWFQAMERFKYYLSEISYEMA